MQTLLDTLPAPETNARDPRRYFEAVGDDRSALADAAPVVLVSGNHQSL